MIVSISPLPAEYSGKESSTACPFYPKYTLLRSLSMWFGWRCALIAKLNVMITSVTFRLS